MASPNPNPSPKPRRFRRVRTPTILQMESTECGAAALGVILGYYGRFVPLEELRVECRVSRDGSNALYVKKCAEKYGLTGRGFRRTVEELRTLEPPFLVFWGLNHFLVVEGFGRDRVYLSDPATGRRSVDERTFRESYTGIVFRFEPGPDFRKGGQRPSTWRAIRGRMRGARESVIFVILAGLAVVVCELVAASYSLVFVDQILVEERRHWIRPLLLAMGVTAAVRVVAGEIQLGALRRLKLGLAMSHSARFLWHVLRLPVGFFQQRYAGDVASRVDGNSLVADLISGQLATTIVGLLMAGLYAAVIWEFDPALTVVGVSLGCLNLVGISAAARLLSDEHLKIRQVRARLHGTMTRALQIIETIKAGASESEILARLSGYQARVTNSFQLVGAAAAGLVLLPPFLLLATTAAVLWIGGLHVIDGLMSVGALLALQTLMVQFNRPFGDLVRLGSGVQALQAELSRLDDVFQYDQDPVFDPHRSEGDDAPPRRLSGRLVLRNITFGYNHTIDEPLIKNFSLEIQPGSRVAIVGLSGSGKSTIGKLVAGLYRPWSGEILYDGRSIDEIPRDVFTSQVALVDDQTFLFSGTVRENLTLWDDTVPERDVVRAAMDAALHRDLIQRRGGYYAAVSEGARNLSGGQRQRMEIARALLRNPALIVLDEATGALDPLTEAQVDDNLRRRGATCLIIAHRLSTIRDCDEIVVLRQGKVVQRGTHDELMADATGPYFELQAAGQELEASRSALPGADRPRALPPPPSANGSVPAGTDPTALHDRPDGSGAEPAEDEPAPSTRLISRSLGRLVQELERFGETVTAAGNRPLPLDDEEAVWRVVAGRVDVFYEQPPDPGQERGSRRHLCRVEEGGAIFAVEGVRSEERGGLLAVGVGQARLSKFPRADLVRLSLEPEWRHAVAELVDDWVDRITRATEPPDAPAQSVWLDAGEAAELAREQAVTSRSRVVWVHLPSGRVRFSGQVRVPDCPLGSRFPVSSHGWLAVEQPGEVRPCDTETLMEDGDPWEGLKRFHRVVLDALAFARRRDRAVRHAQLELAGLRDDAKVAAALTGLVRLAQPDAPDSPLGEADDRLVAACRAVASALGIELRVLPLEEAADPLRVLARASGFTTRRVRLDGAWWKTDGGPLLGFLADGDRPVALLPHEQAGYLLLDPARGTREPLTDERAKALAPTAVMFYRSLAGAKATVADLTRLAVPALRGEFRTLVAMGVVCGLLGLLVPATAGVLIDDVIPRADRPALGTLCGFLVAVGLSIAGFQAVQGFALVRIRGRLESTLLPALWDRLFSLPPRFFAGHESGELSLRALGLSRVIEVLTGTAVATLAVSVFSFMNVIILFAFHARLATLALALIAVAPLTLATALPFLWRRQRRISRAQGKISSLLLMLLGGVARLRVAGAERRAFSLWASSYRGQLEQALKYQQLSDRLVLFGDVWPLVALAAVFTAVAAQEPGEMSTGELIAFNLAAGQALAAVVGLSKAVLPLLNGLEQYERFRPILEARPETEGVVGESVKLGGAVRLSNVSFRYDPDGPLVLDDVSVQVRPGEFVAVVGPSGSGKSTLLRLLLGFETPTEGSVSYDGRDLSTLDVQEVRRQAGVVLQDAQLLPGDVYTNIVGFAPNLTRDDAWRAAELAGLADDIEAMPMGIHTVIGEGGGSLSSGQRQRLIIARALAGGPKVLYFDEATSALDNLSQALISRSIHTKLRGTSRLVIAHRLSTVADADRIYVMSGGRVVQHGRYAQLVDEPGPFRDLARRQSLV